MGCISLCVTSAGILSVVTVVQLTVNPLIAVSVRDGWGPGDEARTVNL